MTRRARTRSAARTLAAGVVVALAAPTTVAAAAPAPSADTSSTTYELPGEDVFPEGVTVEGHDFYVSSTTDGTVFRGRLGRRQAEVFLPGGEDGRTSAIGLASTRTRLLVAGGPTGQVFVYDRRTGDFLGSFSNGRVAAGEPTFVNDLRVAASGDVFATDSGADVVYRLPAAAVRSLDPAGDPTTMTEFAAFAGLDPTGAFNANGVVVSRDGQYLLVVQSDTGALFRVSTTSGEVQPVDLGPDDLAAGDGLGLRGRTLYVVERTEDAERVVRLRLADDLLSARVTGSITDSTFDDPTTVALAGERLLVVNSQFGARSAGVEPVEPFTVSSLPR